MKRVISGLAIKKFYEFVILAFAITPLVVQAVPITSADYEGGGTEFNFDSASGWAFTTNEDLTVTGLGVYDIGDFGLAENHDVGIFSANDFSLIASTTVGAGASANFEAGTVGGTFYNNIAAVTLLAGVDYYILANNWTIDSYAFGNGVTFADQINWSGFVDGSSNSIFSDPFFNNGLPGNLGANFIFDTAAAVSEPSSIFLIGLGLIGLGVLRQKRR